MCYYGENDLKAERLYITHWVKEAETIKTYYYTSKNYVYEIEKDDFVLQSGSEWKKGNGFITIDIENGTAKVFTINSKFGRFRSVNLEK